jgi:aldose 1-epimerase
VTPERADRVRARQRRTGIAPGASRSVTHVPRPPSCEQIEIALEDQRALVVEVGGGLRAYSAAGRELVDGYRPDEMSTAGRGQLLLPWPNRIRDGSYEFDGRRQQLPVNDVPERDAIHGLVRWVAWSVAVREPHRVVLRHSVHPQPGYPFSLDVDTQYALSAEGLRVTTTATNVGGDACPYGCGAHPYLRLGTQKVDALTLRAPARTVLVSDERGIPISSESVDGTEYDFRRPRRIGSTRLDNAFTDLERDGDGLARISLGDPETGDSVTLWVDDAHPYLMLFTGDSVRDVDRRSLAVEPMTCPPNAFQTGESLIRLEPSQSFTTTWGIAGGR